MPVSWPDDVDDILGGDAVAALAWLTPADGVVITPMAPLGLRDRAAGTVTLTTSLGLWRKLERIRSNPRVAIAYHSREHGFSQRSDYILAQGRASFASAPDRAWLESITPQWDRFLGPRHGGLRGRWLDAYYWQRIAIVVTVERILAYPDAVGEPRVLGSPPAADPPPQTAPRKGTGPRISVGAVAADVERLPHTLLGWAGGDGAPLVLPAALAPGSGEDGVRLSVPGGAAPDRRAGLTSHAFHPRMIGQEQRIHTGWLDRDEDGALRYAPHTRRGYRLPPSKALFTLASGLVTRSGIRKARTVGLAD